MEIALATDNNYALACGICIKSIFHNNINEICNVYILTDGLSNKNIKKFNQLSKLKNHHVNIVNISIEHFKNLKVSERFRVSIYYRFLLPDLINKPKILYLDCDIIVNDCLKELWDIDLANYSCAAIEDQAGDDIKIHNRIGYDGTYFNSGVLLLNLDYWRKFSIKDKLVEFIYNNPDTCIFPDQDAINIILKNTIKRVGFKFNFQSLLLEGKENLLLHKNKWEQIENAKKKPIIIHYTDSCKPWHKECIHPLKDYFLHYKSISPWKKSPLTYYNFLGAVKNKIRKIWN